MRLIIREEQTRVLRRRALKDFHENLTFRIKTVFGEQVKHIPEAALGDIIWEGIEKANSYGIDIETDVVRFVEYSIIYNLNFDTDPEMPWAGETLSRAEMDGSTKIKTLDYCDDNYMRPTREEIVQNNLRQMSARK